jgi:hypothetical protein
MLTTAPDTAAELAANLLIHYSFDLSGYNVRELINRWRAEYPINWLHLAVVEALYQGRYKAVSVQQILVFWQRRGQVIHHFNMEFERLICSKFPESLNAVSTPVLPPVTQKINSQLSPGKVSNNSRQSHTPPRYLMSGEEEGKRRHREESNVLTAPSFRIAADAPNRQLAAAVSQRLIGQGSLPVNAPAPIPVESPKMLPPAANNPPIEQFTPQMSDRSESFTSKLKAMSSEQDTGDR